MLLRLIALFLVSFFTLNPLSAAIVIKSPPVGYFPTYNILKTPAFHSGFFSAFFTVLGFMEDCEKDHRNGYDIDFGDEGAFYEPSMGPNWWTYYFAPLHKTCEGKYDNKIIKEEEKTYFSFSALNHSRNDVKALIDKYIQINENVLFAVDSFAEDAVKGSPLIGVNYQRPDRLRVNFIRNFSAFFTKIDGLLAGDGSFYKIFVSTDDEEFLEEMISRYGERVIYREIPRGNKAEKALYLSATPHFDKGFDEIVDCLLLAKCDAIIRTNSHISTAASFFNPDSEIISVRLMPMRKI